MKHLKTIIAMFLVLAFGLSSAMAATVSVAASGGDYTSMDAAVADLGTWGDGSNDTVELADEVFVTQTQTRPMPGGGNDITIKAASGASPVVVADASTGLRRVFQMTDGGNLFIDGITFIGADGVNTSLSEGIFNLEADTVGAPVNVKITNCVVTANAGGNVPKTDYSAASPGTGMLNKAIAIAEDPWRESLNVVVEASTFAFLTDKAVTVGGRDPITDATANAGITRDFTFDHVLIARCGQGIATSNTVGNPANSTPNPTLTVTNSLITDWNGRGIALKPGAQGNNVTVLIQDTIIGPTGSGSPVDDDTYHGALTAIRFTSHRSGADHIETDNGAGLTGDEDFVLRDCVFGPHGGHDSYLRGRPGNEPNSVSLSNIASSNGMRGDETAAMLAANAALYGGSGPLATDPEFVSLDTTVYDGSVGWFSGTNSLLDVGACSYSGQASDGFYNNNALAGGAQPAACVPVELSDFNIQ